MAHLCEAVNAGCSLRPLWLFLEPFFASNSLQFYAILMQFSTLFDLENETHFELADRGLHDVRRG